MTILHTQSKLLLLTIVVVLLTCVIFYSRTLHKDLKYEVTRSSIISSPTYEVALRSQIDPVVYQQKQKEIYIQNIISSMTVEEKVGQLFIWKAQGTSVLPEYRAFLTRTHASGIILMKDNISSNLKNYISEVQVYTDIPLFISIDQEGGVVKRLTEDPNPGASNLSSPQLACNSFKQTSQILNEYGINLNFGVVGDIAWYPDSFITPRSFSNNPTKVAQLSGAAIQCSNSSFTTIKHFPGHGRTRLDSHKTIPKTDVTFEEWEKTDALPFKNSIESGVDFIMMGHINYSKIDNKPASLSSIQVRNLRNMGYKGIIITDDMGMLHDSNIDPFFALDEAINAGNDMFLYVDTTNAEKLYNHVVHKVKKGEVSQNRIDQSLRRILEKKYELLEL